ncbi:MAG: hypothetical protein AAGA48_19815 [Myxococcota bacterium]
MIRVVGVRTGVEVFASETDSLVEIPDLNGTTFNFLDQLAKSPSFAPLRWSRATKRVTNPFLWTHPIWNATDTQRLGQLVLCSPDAQGVMDALAKKKVDQTLMDLLFASLKPGQEDWLWKSGQAWPGTFVMKSSGWPQLVRVDWDRTRYKQTAFPRQNANGGPVPATADPQVRASYIIETDPRFPAPAGALVVRKDKVQQWFAARSYAPFDLIQPSPTGTWRFVKLTQWPPPGASLPYYSTMALSALKV